MPVFQLWLFFFQCNRMSKGHNSEKLLNAIWKEKYKYNKFKLIFTISFNFFLIKLRDTCPIILNHLGKKLQVQQIFKNVIHHFFFNLWDVHVNHLKHFYHMLLGTTQMPDTMRSSFRAKHMNDSTFSKKGYGCKWRLENTLRHKLK